MNPPAVSPDPPSRWPAEQNLRSWLSHLDARGRLGRVRSRVDPDQEVSAVLERLDGRRSVLFRDVAGAEFPLAGNLVLSRADLAEAMDCPAPETTTRYLAALTRPRPWAPVPDTEAPVLTHRLDGDTLLSRLPLTVQHEHDAGRYLTSGLLVVRDPATSATSLSINRMLAVGERNLRTLVLPGRLRRILAATERRGLDLDVAIVVGVDPPLGLASQVPGAGRTVDDLEVASALRGTPLPVTRCPANGLPVPADAEFVLAGRFRAAVREPEGPFGEFPRTYGPSAPAPVIELTEGWHRGAAVFQTILSGGREHFLLGGIPREAALLRTLRQAHPDVVAVRLTEAGSCRLHAVVSVREGADGSATNVLLATLGGPGAVKYAVVVDDDVDIHDDEQVGWALATRVQADRDVLVVPRAAGSGLDPSASAGVTAKLGIDATVPADGRHRHARMRVHPTRPEWIERFLAEAATS
ncbi:UbiD family decarboxylase [Micromonospora narathiwatensis]|uniref:2,5-furandicarboxylate decarboxylase 1 n=1 Tax=Micromonospora narathiwatensis TaxID=299146 RepID=A0A1A8ZS69_9ACTN|nr:UbiD family decarboxylase [Micromonospora narathiwatensis]SBT46706.1 2,5-furandicarboxylate decarboxylase 1 [Micromonospora narathiwatensis]